MRNETGSWGVVGDTLLAVLAVMSVAARGAHAADTTTSTSQETELQTVTVTAAKIRSLEQSTPTGSCLGLNAQDLPATLDIIDNDEMLGRGFTNARTAPTTQAGG